MKKRFEAILLPGSVLPASLAYPVLIDELGDDVDATAKELEIYAGDAPPSGYGLHSEVDGIASAADEAGFDRFHLVGYSAGGAASLAFCAAHPERLLSLTLNEPAWSGNDGFSTEEAAVWRRFEEISALPPGEMMGAFTAIHLASGVNPPPPVGEPPPWMSKRPPALKVLMSVFLSSSLDLDAMRRFTGPVLFTLGGKSNPAYFGRAAERLSHVFGDFTVEVFEDRHHFDPPHRTEPERLARSLRALWERAGS
ncbi:MAG: alpha/beta fold hydrolase [Actinomycetota bacterium]